MKKLNEVKRIIKKEQLLIFKDKMDFSKSLRIRILVCFLFRNFRYYQYKLMKSFRMFNFYSNQKGHYFKKIYWGRKYGKYSLKLHCQINCSNIGGGFFFEHPNIVINKSAIIGNDLHCIGNNCIGSTDKGAPVLGNNVFLGFGAIVIGDVKIADNVKIGAGAIITKDILEPGSIVVGNNRIIKR